MYFIFKKFSRASKSNKVKKKYNERIKYKGHFNNGITTSNIKQNKSFWFIFTDAI